MEDGVNEFEMQLKKGGVERDKGLLIVHSRSDVEYSGVQYKKTDHCLI